MNNSSNASVVPEGDSVLARAVSKVKRHVLPLFVIMFILNYIDRVNIGFVRTHMEHDLGIGAAAYGLGAGLFFIGYALFEVPSNMLLQKVGARIWLTRIMFTWGIVATMRLQLSPWLAIAPNRRTPNSNLQHVLYVKESRRH